MNSAGLGISPISCWEIAELVEYNRLILPLPVRKAACLLCHYEKIFGIASYQDRVRLLRANDSMANYFEQ
jgi:hypothetical protein